MTTVEQLLQDIQATPKGPQIAAIFDFDGTLIAGYSATALIREQVRRGDVSPRQFLEMMGAAASFGLGNMSFSAMMASSAQFMRGIREDTYRELGEALYNKQLARLVYPESRALVNAHLARGHTVAIVSSATPYQVRPAARDLGIAHVLCTELEVRDGLFSGAVVHPTCFGEGKVEAAETLAGTHDADLDDSFFYSDSHDDLPLLERVGRPRVLNPSTRLARIARDRHWPTARFGSRGRPSAAQFVRSVAATGSLVSSFVAGLPVYALTGSRRAANNFSFSLFADTASALIGLELQVEGEEHLWSQRPAVFVFNHQSKADVIVIARLLRRDIAAVGKQEIKKENPLIGRVMEMGGVVLIDRSDARSAIKAMQPLVDVMKNEGKSVVLAPEGTRTVSPRLAPFKKGAFHLALQAGVPMVPIVIHNAGDVAPKGDFVFRPATVRVQVLPPVDTRKWSVKTINRHVREVRNQFARALGQPEEGPAPDPAQSGNETRTGGSGAGRSASRKKAVTRKSVPKKAAEKKEPAKKTGGARDAASADAAGPTPRARARRTTAGRGGSASSPRATSGK
ncbi:MAG: HAD-IB family hydrolase [Halioglobus sp.]|nr:HAD-IB family hydrolase [Halioglobus sp.]